jgi:ABC-type molybdate transport system substrate-binding protein
MTHPQALTAAGRSGPTVMFARNRLCALVRPGLAVTSESLLDRILDAQIRLGISTPKADPSGDYAWEVFRKAEAISPGSYATLDKKALKLTGGPASPPPPGRSVYGALVAGRQADIFLAYRTNALVVMRENAGQQTVPLPAALAVGADYGLTVMRDAPAVAQRLADHILSADGQRVLAQHGFDPPGPEK